MYELPATLNSFERKLVHELAEEFSLHHTSTGAASKRHICVWKDGHSGPDATPSTPATPAPALALALAPAATEAGAALVAARAARAAAGSAAVADWSLPANDEPPAEADAAQATAVAGPGADPGPATGPGAGAPAAEAKPLAPGMVVCNTCKAHVPEVNMEIHEIRCARRQQQLDKQAAADALKASAAAAHASGGGGGGGGGKSNKKSKGKQAKKASGNSAAEDEAEVDALLEAMAKDARTCQDANGCKASVLLTGQVCRFCKKKFCYKHGLPEAHGCGDAVRRAARQGIASSLGHEPSAGSKARRETLARRLNRAVDDKAEARGKDKKKKGKKKGKK